MQNELAKLIADNSPLNYQAACSIIAEHVKPLLTSVGDETTCKGCGAKIYFIKHKNGKKAPYSVIGQSHFIDCSQAKQFKK